MNVLRTPDERFEALPGYPFAPHYHQITGVLRMHYLDEGATRPSTKIIRAGRRRKAQELLSEFRTTGCCRKSALSRYWATCDNRAGAEVMQTVRKVAGFRARLNFGRKFRGIWPFNIRSNTKIRTLIDLFRANREFSHGLHGICSREFKSKNGALLRDVD